MAAAACQAASRAPWKETCCAALSSDIATSGSIQFRFSPDGSQFQGSYAVGGPNANGSQAWNGTRAGPVAATPLDVLEQRADLARVSQSGAAPEEQAKQACNKLLANTFAIEGDVLRTRITVPRNDFTPVLGAPQGGTLYLEFGAVSLSFERPVELSDADRRNGWQFHQKASLQARSFQVADRPGAQNWRNFGQPTAVIDCFYSIRNNRASISVEKPFERLLGQEFPAMAAWSRP